MIRKYYEILTIRSKQIRSDIFEIIPSEKKCELKLYTKLLKQKYAMSW